MNKKINVLLLRRISLVCVFSSIVISLIANIFSNIILTLIGIGLLIIFFLISIIFWRCPYCKKRLPMRFSMKNVDEVLCPYCDANLLYGENNK